MKILIVTQWFDPEPTFKGIIFAKGLVEAGHEVEVITGIPNYPGGKFYDGYKFKLHHKEKIEGITLHRVGLYPSHDSGALKRIANYVSFALTSSLCGVFSASKPDIIYSYHPPLTTALSAWVISLFRRAPFVVDVQDLWPDTLAATGMLNNKKILAIVNLFCNFVYKKASRIVVLSPGFKAKLIERGVPEEKVEIIYNWSDEKALKNGCFTEQKLPENGNKNIVFAGNLGIAQGLPAIVKAAQILQEREEKVNIVFIGDGIDKINAIEMAKDLKLNNTFFLERVPMNEVGSLLKQSDFLLVHLINDILFSITIPSKVQAYLAIGKPILMAVNGDAAELIKESNTGVICESDNSLSIADGASSLMRMSQTELDKLALNSSSFYTKELSTSVGISKFTQVFKEVYDETYF